MNRHDDKYDVALKAAQNVYQLGNWLDHEVRAMAEYILATPSAGGARWIPVTERLPKHMEQVIVEGGIAYWCDPSPEWPEGKFYTVTACDWPGRPIQWDVTHWMPMPSKPNAIEDNAAPGAEVTAPIRQERPEGRPGAAAPSHEAPISGDISLKLAEHGIDPAWYLEAKRIAARILDYEWQSQGDRQATMVANISFAIKEAVEKATPSSIAPKPTPFEEEGVRDPVLRFAVLMERELKANDHKGGWCACDGRWLLQRMREELVELERLMLGTSAPSPAEIGSEAADVANFAMMICDNLGALPTGPLTRSARGEQP